MQKHQIDENHETKKAILKIVGPIVLLAGIICIGIGVADFLGAFNKFNEFSGFGMGMHSAGPKHSGLIFLGMPLLFVGLVMCNFAFMGDVAKYTSQEMAPVATDTFNYVAKGAKEGIKNVAGAIHEGVHGTESSHTAASCPACQGANEEDARFCKHCGREMPRKQFCSKCGSENDQDARFCNNCGNSLE